MQRPSPSPWLMRPVPRPHARVRLYCLPHAGGAASAYWSWAGSAADFVEVCPVQLPGRESRFDEPAMGDPARIAEALLEQIGIADDRPYALFGHSMGAMLAFEVASRARRAGTGGPMHLFVSAFHSPTLPYRNPKVAGLSDEDLIAALIDYGGIPQELITNPEYVKLLLPTIRKDFAMVESFGVVPGPGVDCPLSVFGGQDDGYVTTAELEAWQEATSGHCTVRMLPGGHFYLPDATDAVLAALAQDLVLDMELSR